MGKSWGRVRTVFAVVVALAVPAGLLLHSTASAYMDSQAARSAVIQALAALSQATEGDRPREGEKAPEGGRPRELTGEQREGIMKVVNSYYELIRTGNARGAWELIHPDTRGKWAEEQWVESRSQGIEESMQVDGPGGGSALMGVFMVGREYEVKEVATDGPGGWAHVVVRLDSPLTVALRKSGDGWAIDLAETDDATALESVRGALRAIAPGKTGETMLNLIMASEMGGSPGGVLELPAMDLAERSTEIREATITEDRARVALNTRGALHVAVPLENKGGRWAIAWSGGELKVITPETNVREEFAGVRANNRGRQASCQSNLKCIALAALMYCSDYDERMPIADRWCGALMPYCKNEQIFTCPSDDDQWSYAMNYKLSRQTLDKVIAPAATYLLFESEPSRKDAWDKDTYPGASLANPPRHGDFNNFAYADGHVKALAQSAVSFDGFRVVDNKGGVMEPMPGAVAPGPAPGGPPPPPPGAKGGAGG